MLEREAKLNDLFPEVQASVAIFENLIFVQLIPRFIQYALNSHFFKYTQGGLS
jgi:hypothetical protein